MKTKNQGWGVPVPGKVANTEVPNPPKDATGETRTGCPNTCEWEIGMKRTEVALACCAPFLPLGALVFLLWYFTWYFYPGIFTMGQESLVGRAE